MGQRTRKNRGSKDRFKGTFLDQAGARVVELAGLVSSGGAEDLEMAAHDLVRMSETAQSLGLREVSEQARFTSDAVIAGKAARALRHLGRSVRRAAGLRRLGPLILIGPDAVVSAVAAEAHLCAEPLQIFPDVRAFASAVHVLEPTAVCLPVEALGAVKQLSEMESFPILVHSAPGAFRAQLEATSAGACGVLRQPFTLGDLTRLARWKSLASKKRGEVLLLAPEGEAREALQRALESLGIATVATDVPTELSPSLESGAPDAILLGDKVGGVPAALLAGMIRAHPRGGHLPILVTGRPASPGALRALGVDDVMRASADPNHVARRVSDRISRIGAFPWTIDPSTGLPNRLGVLTQFDRLLRQTHRAGGRLTVCVIELEGMRGIVESMGHSVLSDARRIIVGTLSTNLRSGDVWGALSVGQLLVALPGIDAEVGRRRVVEALAGVMSAFGEHPVLESVRLTMGVTDATLGLEGIALRAERDLSAG